MCPTASGATYEEEDFEQADEVANLQTSDACLAWTTW